MLQLVFKGLLIDVRADSSGLLSYDPVHVLCLYCACRKIDKIFSSLEKSNNSNISLQAQVSCFSGSLREIQFQIHVHLLLSFLKKQILTRWNFEENDF